MSNLSSGFRNVDIDDNLVAGVRYSRPTTSSVVETRETVKYTPFGSDSFQLGGGRGIAFKLTGTNFLDLPTATIHMNVTHAEDAAAKQTALLRDGVASLFERMVIKVGGQVVEDINDYDQLSQILTLSSMPRNYYDIQYATEAGVWQFSDYKAQSAKNQHERLYKNNSRYTFSLNLAMVSGFFKIQKFLPLFALGSAGVEVELYLNTYDRAMYQLKHTDDANNETNELLGITGATAGAVGTKKVTIDNIKLAIDSVKIDAQYTEALRQMIQSDVGLTLHFDSYASTQNTLAQATNHDLSISQGVSHMKSLYAVVLANSFTDLEYDHWRTDTSDSKNFKQYKLRVGGKVYPNEAIDNFSEAYGMLQKAFHQQAMVGSGGVLDYKRFMTNKFIIAMDFETVIGSNHVSPVDTKLMGGQINLQLQLDTNKMPADKRLLSFVHHDRFIVMSNGSVALLE